MRRPAAFFYRSVRRRTRRARLRAFSSVRTAIRNLDLAIRDSPSLASLSYWYGRIAASAGRPHQRLFRQARVVPVALATGPSPVAGALRFTERQTPLQRRRKGAAAPSLRAGPCQCPCPAPCRSEMPVPPLWSRRMRFSDSALFIGASLVMAYRLGARSLLLSPALLQAIERLAPAGSPRSVPRIEAGSGGGHHQP